MTDAITLTVDASQADRKLRALPEAVRGRLRSVIVRDTKDLATLVRSNLSGAVLKTRTGKLLASIKSELVESATSIFGRVYSQGVAYAGIQEHGGQTKAHMIYPVRAQALHFFIGNKEIFAKSVRHPGSKIPARPYLGSALEAMRFRIVDDMTRAARGAWPS